MQQEQGKHIHNNELSLFMDDIKLGSYSCIKNELDKVEHIKLYRNEGGALFEAMRIARHIQRNDITVTSYGRCISACTLILFASPEPAITNLSVIGSHQTNLDQSILFSPISFAMNRAKQSILKNTNRDIDFNYYNSVIDNTDFKNIHIHTEEALLKSNLITMKL